MESYTKQLEDLKEKAQNNKEEKIKLEQQLKSLQDQQKKLIEELIPLKVDPKNLESIIQELEVGIKEELQEISGILNNE